MEKVKPREHDVQKSGGLSTSVRIICGVQERFLIS